MEASTRVAGNPPRWPLKVVAFLLLLLLFTAFIATTFNYVLRAERDEIAGRYDVFRYYGPLTFYIDQRIQSGEFPLWNPLVYCGLPLAGNSQSFLFYPPNLIRSLFIRPLSPYSTQMGLVVLMGLHLLLAAIGTCCLARAHGMSVPAAITSAIVFSFSALMVRRMGEYHFVTTLGWLPFLLLLTKAMLDARQMRRWLFFALLGGILFGLSILGGFLQIVNYVALTVGIYALLWVVLTPMATSSEKPTRGIKRYVLLLCGVGLIIGLGALLAAPMLASTVELSSFSARHKGTTVPMYSDLLKWDLKRLYQSFVVFAGMKYETETLRNAGVGALLLALLGLTHTRRRLALVFGLIYLVLLDCTIGPPFPMGSIVERLTPFSMSAYSRAYDFAMLPLALLAGMGVDAVSRPASSPQRNWFRFLWVAYGGAFTLLPLYDWTQKGNYYLPVGNIVFLLPLTLLVVLLFMAVLHYPRGFRLLLMFVLPVLVFLETFAWNQVYFPWLVKKNLRDVEPVASGPVAMPSENKRHTDPIPNRGLYSLRPAMNGVDPLHVAEMRDFLSGQPRDQRSHRLVEDWEPTCENHRGNLYLKRFFWLSRQYARGAAPGKQEVFPSATTVFLPDAAPAEVPEVAREALPARSISEQAQRLDLPHVAERFSARGRQTFSKTFAFALPTAATGAQGVMHSALFLRYRTDVGAEISTIVTDVQSGRDEWAKRHRVGRTDAPQTLEIPLPDFAQARATVSFKLNGAGNLELLEAYVLSDTLDEDRFIAIEEFAANHVRLRVGPLDGPRILTYLDAMYPGWKVYLDGQERELMTANDLFKAVVVPAGTHEVVFRFEPKVTYAGIGVSFGALVLALVLLVLLRPRRERMVIEELVELPPAPPPFATETERQHVDPM